MNAKISQLTLRQKAELLTGKGFWRTKDFKDADIRSIFLADGPSGIRKQAAKSDHLGFNPSLPATCFPSAAAMANSWNTELAERAGAALGEEALSQGVDVLLGPGVCIKRNPRCGRNFEYFSEDPYLAGKTAAAYVRGIQAQGVAACVKHFACNSQEERRMVSDSVIDERALREIYLTAFEIAVKEGGAYSVMTSYNKVNGVFADENAHLIRDILRGEWGFDGVVVSDWAGCNDKVASTAAGSDLEMPYCRYGVDDVVEAVESGKLDIKYVDECAERILALTEKTRPDESKQACALSEHHALARECAAESIVLLKNDGVLPLQSGVKVAVIGDFAEKPRYQGAGSSTVNPTRLDTVKEEIYRSGLNIVGYERGFKRYGGKGGRLLKRAVNLVSRADAAVLFLGLDEFSEVEGLDRAHIKMPYNQTRLYHALVATGKKVVVVLSCGCSVTTDWARRANAVVYTGLGGQAGAGAVADVLTGKVNPSGKLAETFPSPYDPCASAEYFPGKNMTAEYRESVYVGYRYFDKRGLKVAYPFGHGLSYTDFEYTDLSVTESGAEFTLSNIGGRDGAEVAQLYVGKAQSNIFRPLRELKGFKKVFLKVGESVSVHIPFDDKTFRYFNVATNSWEIEGGEYEISVCSSSRDIRLKGIYEAEGTNAASPYDRGKLPSYFGGNVLSVRDEEFACLLGREPPADDYPFYKKNRMVIDENCTVADLRYSRGWTGRAFSRAVRFAVAFCGKFGMKKKANTLVMGVLHQPVRGLAKYGEMSRRKMEGLIEMFNGKFFGGLGKVLSRR